MWSDTPHGCDLTPYCHGSRLWKYFICEFCKRSWRVVAETGPNEYGQYRLVYESRIGNYIETRDYR